MPELSSLLPLKDYDKNRKKFSFTRNECERLGCPHPVIYYPFRDRQGRRLLICQACRYADDEWTKLTRNNKSKIRERSEHVDFSSLSQKNGSDRTPA